MTALQRAGLIYASEHWRDQRYLYLIHPMHEGDRKREYVGADQGNIARARAGIERGKEFDALSAKLKELERHMRVGLESLQEAARVLK